MTITQIIAILFGGGILITLIKLVYSVGKFSQRFETMSGTLEEIDADVEETKAAVIEMQDTFNRLGYPMQRVLRAASPLVLTDFGRKIVEESGFDDIFAENREVIIGWVKTLNPRNQYDAQEHSRQVLLEHKDDPLFEPLKTYAFAHGEVSVEQILRAGSVIVRDEILKELGLT